MFKTMDPQDVWDLLEGQEDVITKEVESEKAYYDGLECPICEGVGALKIAAYTDANAFDEFKELYGPIPNIVACIHCGTEFDPDTGIITKTEASTIHVPD